MVGKIAAQSVALFVPGARMPGVPVLKQLHHNPEHHGRMKHVARRHFFICECVENHQIRVPFVRTDENDADFFTKVLPGRKFFPLRNKIMNIADSELDVPRLRGGVEV